MHRWDFVFGLVSVLLVCFIVSCSAVFTCLDLFSSFCLVMLGGVVGFCVVLSGSVWCWAVVSGYLVSKEL